MPRKPNQPKKSEAFHLHLVLPGEVVMALDAKAAALQEQAPGSRVTRSEAGRRAIYKFLNLKG